MKKIALLLVLASLFCWLIGCSSTPEPEEVIGFDNSQAPVAAVSPSPTAPAALTSPDATAVTPDPGLPTGTPKPSPTPEANVDPEAVETPSSKMPKNMKEATKINDAVYGWIEVPNTNINYPILYDADWYYNTHDIFKKKTNSGSIYSYYKVLTRNNVIAGHNMRKAGTMLNGLHKLQDSKDSLKTKANRTFEIDWFGLSKWEVWALYETTDSEPTSTLKDNVHHLADKSSAEVQSWIDKQKKRSEIDLGVSVSPDDFLMTIVTCGDNYDYSDAQSRLYFFLKCPAPAK